MVDLYINACGYRNVCHLGVTSASGVHDRIKKNVIKVRLFLSFIKNF
jgi:hypothetical protein